MSPLQVDVLVRYVRRLRDDSPSAGSSDRDLLRCYALDRDEAAFASLVQRHGALVWSVCRRALGHQDAEDVFQATFLVLARKAAAVRWQESVGPWLHAVATRLARKVRTEGRGLRPLVDPASAHPGPLDRMSAQELLVALDEELATLPEKCRGPLVLCLLQGKTQDEAARLLGTSLSSVRRYLERGRDRLHARLTRRGLSLPVACAAVLAHSAVSAAPTVVVTGSATSARAVALAQTLLRPASTKLKAGLALMLVLGAAVAGIGLAADRPRSEVAAPAPKKAPPAEQAVQEAPNRLDAHGDPLPAGARARLGTTRFRQGAWIYSLAYSPDGKLLATGGGDEALCLWDATTGRCLHRLVGHRRSCQRVAFSPNGKMLATVGWEEAAIILWDVASGKEARRLRGHPRYTHGATFSPDGKFLASTGLEGGAVLWDLQSGKAIRHLPDGNKTLCHVAYSPNGKTLFAGCGDSSLRLWDVATGKERVLSRGGSWVQSVSFSHDGKRVAVGRINGTAAVWDLAAGKLVREWSGYKGYMYTVVFSPDDKRLAVSSYRSFDFRAPPSARVYDIATGLEAVPLEANWGSVTGVAFAPDGKVLAASDGYCVRRWDLATGREITPRAAHRGGVWSLAVSPDGKTVYSGAQDSTVRAWDVGTGRELFNLSGHASGVLGVRLTPDGKVLGTADTDSVARLWNAETGKVLWKIDVPGRPIRSIAMTADGRSLVTGTDDKFLRFWDVTTGKESRSIAVGGRAYCMAASADGRTIGIGGDSQGSQCVRLVDVVAGRSTDTNKDLDHVTGVAISPDGRWLASALDGYRKFHLRLHALPDGKEVRQFRGHSAGARDVAFSPDGWALASASRDGTVRLWEVATGQERQRLEGHQGHLHAVAFSPDGRSLFSGGDDTTVLVWDLTDRTTASRKGKAPTAAQLEQQWEELAGASAPRAYEAICYLAAFPEKAVPLLRGRLLKVQPTAKRIAQLIKDLDDDEFEVRERATRALEKLGRLIEPDLREARASAKGLEVRRRLERLLAGITGPADPHAQSEGLRLLRALEVLERAGTPAARQALEALVREKGKPDLMRAIEAALKRLERRASGK